MVRFTTLLFGVSLLLSCVSDELGQFSELSASDASSARTEWSVIFNFPSLAS